MRLVTLYEESTGTEELTFMYLSMVNERGLWFSVYGFSDGARIVVAPAYDDINNPSAGAATAVIKDGMAFMRPKVFVNRYFGALGDVTIAPVKERPGDKEAVLLAIEEFKDHGVKLF